MTALRIIRPTAPGGAANDVQYRDSAGRFAGSSGLTYNPATTTLTVSGMTVGPGAAGVTKISSTGGLLLEGLGAQGITLNGTTGGVSVSLSLSTGVQFSDSRGTSLYLLDGNLLLLGGSAPLGSETLFQAPLYEDFSGCPPFNFATDSGTVFKFGEEVLGTREAGFFGSLSPKRTISGSRASGAALQSVIAALVAYGLATDATTA